MKSNEIQIFDFGIFLVENRFVPEDCATIIREPHDESGIRRGERIYINNHLFKLIKDNIVDYTEILRLKFHIGRIEDLTTILK